MKLRADSLAVLFFLAVGGCTRSIEREIDSVIERGASFLVARQKEDGTWRAGTHAVFRNGTALTPHAAQSLSLARVDQDAIGRARAWLESIDGERLEYPTYGAADAARIADDPTKWLRLLRSRQKSAENAGPASIGGWAYPAGPIGIETESNLSATAYAVCALRDLSNSGLKFEVSNPAIAFMTRCRNHDGGILFGPTEAADNKAGPQISYGTMTADGVRGLLACGVRRDDPRVRDGVKWLVDRFDPSQVSGDFLPSRQPLRNANYFYYLDAITDVFTRARVSRKLWADQIAAELIRRQREDGSWQNDISAGREDEPIVATGFALRALARCRR